jgi:hypothetical protein
MYNIINIDTDIVKEDMDNFENQMEEYHQHLNDLKVGVRIEEKSPKKFTFITDDLKILSYKPSSNANIVEKKDDNNQIEIKKLMKYTKKGKRNMMKHINEQPLVDISSIISELNKKTEDEGTVQLVRREIINSINLEDIFNKKKAALKEYWKDSELPKLEDYESK